MVTAEVVAQLGEDRDLDLDLFQQAQRHQFAIEQAIGPQAGVNRLQHALDALEIRRLAAERQEYRLPLRAHARMLIVDHHLDIGGRAAAVLTTYVAQRKRAAGQRRRDRCGDPAVALDEQVFILLEAQDGVGDETRRLVGLAQQQRKLPMQLIELSAERDGAVHHVAVLRPGAGVDSDRPMLVVAQDAYGHVLNSRPEKKGSQGMPWEPDYPRRRFPPPSGGNPSRLRYYWML